MDSERTIEDHFIDWESETFGLGYGTGEPHVLSSLRVFLDLCREGPYQHSYDYQKIEATLGGPVTWLLINILGKAHLIEYGTSPRFAWLTKQGIALQNFMLSRDVDALVDLVCLAKDPALCSPSFCNCGPEGYSQKKLCHNPFWVEHAQ